MDENVEILSLEIQELLILANFSCTIDWALCCCLHIPSNICLKLYIFQFLPYLYCTCISVIIACLNLNFCYLLFYLDIVLLYIQMRFLRLSLNPKHLDPIYNPWRILIRLFIFMSVGALHSSFRVTYFLFYAIVLFLHHISFRWHTTDMVVINTFIQSAAIARRRVIHLMVRCSTVVL